MGRTEGCKVTLSPTLVSKHYEPTDSNAMIQTCRWNEVVAQLNVTNERGEFIDLTDFRTNPTIKSN